MGKVNKWVLREPVHHFTGYLVLLSDHDDGVVHIFILRERIPDKQLFQYWHQYIHAAKVYLQLLDR